MPLEPMAVKFPELLTVGTWAGKARGTCRTARRRSEKRGHARG